LGGDWELKSFATDCEKIPELTSFPSEKDMNGKGGFGLAKEKGGKEKSRTFWEKKKGHRWGHKNG